MGVIIKHSTPASTQERRQEFAASFAAYAEWKMRGAIPGVGFGGGAPQGLMRLWRVEDWGEELMPVDVGRRYDDVAGKGLDPLSSCRRHSEQTK